MRNILLSPSGTQHQYRQQHQHQKQKQHQQQYQHQEADKENVTATTSTVNPGAGSRQKKNPLSSLTVASTSTPAKKLKRSAISGVNNRTPPRFRSVNTPDKQYQNQQQQQQQLGWRANEEQRLPLSSYKPPLKSKTDATAAATATAIELPSSTPSTSGPTIMKTRAEIQNNRGEDDFSFAKLRGTVQNFEWKQKEHHSNQQSLSQSQSQPQPQSESSSQSQLHKLDFIKGKSSSSLVRNGNVRNSSKSSGASKINNSISTRSLAISSCSSFGTACTTDSSRSGGSFSINSSSSSTNDDISNSGGNNASMDKNYERMKKDEMKVFNGRDGKSSKFLATAKNNDDGDNEDFSFKKLKEKALGMEKTAGTNTSNVSAALAFTPALSNAANGYNNLKSKSSENNNGGGGDDDVEDFSFEKLKQKAQQDPMTPSRKKTTNSRIAAPHTVCGKSRRRDFVPTPSTSSLPYKRSNSTPKKRPSTSQPPSAHRGTNISGALTSETKKSSNTPNNAFDRSRFQFKPKIKEEEVQATNDSIASVHKLSQWLSDDPFNKKKQLHIRKGEQIANKSKAFEHEELVNGKLKKSKESRAHKERQYFPEGKVSQNKDWLQNHAFGDGRKEEQENDANLLGVVEKRKLLESAFKKKPGTR